MAALLPDVGTGKFKPFDLLANQFIAVAACYKAADSIEQRKQLLAIMRLIANELHSLNLFQVITEFPEPRSR